MHIEKGIYRGPGFAGQHHLAKAVSDKNIKTILNLEMRDSIFETKWCYWQRVQLINLDLNPFLISPWDVQFAVSLLQNESLHPIYVHCRHGRERTGLIIAAYRVRTGTSVEAAYNEMVGLGCRWPFRWFYRRLLEHGAVQ